MINKGNSVLRCYLGMARRRPRALGQPASLRALVICALLLLLLFHDIRIIIISLIPRSLRRRTSEQTSEDLSDTACLTQVFFKSGE